MSRVIEEVVCFNFEGVHQEMESPIGSGIFKFPHTHTFNVKLIRSVPHEHFGQPHRLRENAKRFLEEHYVEHVTGGLDLESDTCQEVASLLVANFGLTSCEVLEDGKHGIKISTH